MKRTPLKRGKPLARTGRLKSKASLRQGCPVKPVNSPRVARRRLECHGTKRRSQWIYGLPCLCGGQHPECSGDTVPAHVKSVGAGGKAADIAPLSWGCHAEQHQHGWDEWHHQAGLAMHYAGPKALYYARLMADRLALEGPDAPGVRS